MKISIKILIPASRIVEEAFFSCCHFFTAKYILSLFLFFFFFFCIRQVALGDVIILNKTDLVSAEQLKRLKDRIR